ncbi:T9SS sorting signal type C domain-containing protein [Flavobacterium sp.]|uniref:T9SS sorting signal type C domain-containing protein n=1 Tax=Flavobacterium sp. TaxID=239 RepID=UPI000EE24949|nr:T9SS sorting signal type C domain-containing protein [Flavobacterium sp.]HCQ14465.1 hypothetical protein [Flavobacterium sp.]
MEKIKKIVLFSLLLMILSLAKINAATLYVNANGTCGSNSPCYTTIQAAINAASAGDIIIVAAGTYTGTVTVNKSVKIYGNNYNVNPNDSSWNYNSARNPESIISTTSGWGFFLSASNIEIKGFQLTGSGGGNSIGNTSITTMFSNWTIENNWIANNTNVQSIFTNGSASSVRVENFVIKNNRIENNSGALRTSINAWKCGTLSITGNYIAGSTYHAINADGFGNGTISNNYFKDAKYGAIQVPTSHSSNQYFVIENNTITGCQTGIYSWTRATQPNIKLSIRNNTILVNAAKLDLNFGAIDLRGTNNNLATPNIIEGNTIIISGIVGTSPVGLFTGGPATAAYGIVLSGSLGLITVNNNSISAIGVNGSPSALPTNIGPDMSGVYLRNQNVSSNPSETELAGTFQIQSNNIEGFKNSIITFNTSTNTLSALPSAATATVIENDLLPSSGGYSILAASGGNLISATCNWYGTTTQLCDKISGNIDYIPFKISSNGPCTGGAASGTPTLCTNTALTNITHDTTATGATGIGTVTGLPAGVTATWASNTITISGIPTSSGTFNYNIPLTGACGTVNATGTITVDSATIAGSINGDQTICANSQLANIVLTGNVGSVVKWQKSSDAVFTNPIDIASTSTTLTGAVVGAITATTYFRAVVQSDSCSSVNTNIIMVSIETTTWNGTSWDNGAPTDPNSTKSILFSGNYSSTASLYGCVMNVTNNAIVTINTGHNVILNGALTVDSGSSFTMQNNSNLIQNTDATNSGNITVKRNSSPLYRLDYTLWSSPVAGTQTLLNFSPLTLSNRFYTYNTSTNLYNSISDPSTATFSIGKGYLIRMPNNWIASSSGTPAAFSGSFTGVPTNGLIVSALVDNGSAFRYNAVGNPYPSAIKIQDFITQNSDKIDGTIWFWRKTNDQNNPITYSTCTAAGCTLNNQHSYFDEDLISIGQGFIVQAKASQSTLTFTNSMRVADNVNQFFKSAQKDRFWLDLMNSSTVKYGQQLIAYVGGTNNYDDGLDGLYINDCPTALTSVVDGKELAINARPNFNIQDVTPIQFRTDVAGTYTISINKTEGVFDGNQDIFIRDNQLGIVQSLTSGNYTFASSSGTFANRFDILYLNPTLDTNTPIFNKESLIVFKNNGLVHINAGTTNIDNVKLFDIRGRLLLKKNKVNATQTTIDTSAIGNQVLLIQITSVDQIKITKKIVN